MKGGYIKVNASAHVWGELRVSFLEAVHALQISGINRLDREESVFDLMMAQDRADCIEQLGVIIDTCQDAIILLHSKQLESETLGTQPDSPKVNDAVEAAGLAQEASE